MVLHRCHRIAKRHWAAGILLAGVLFESGVITLAAAHIASHPEWDDLLAKSKNGVNGECCGLGDAHLVEFDDWRLTSDGAYEVYLLKQWRRIDSWKLTTNTFKNPTGKAIVWYATKYRLEGGAVRLYPVIWCFKPLDTY